MKIVFTTPSLVVAGSGDECLFLVSHQQCIVAATQVYFIVNGYIHVRNFSTMSGSFLAMNSSLRKPLIRKHCLVSKSEGIPAPFLPLDTSAGFIRAALEVWKPEYHLNFSSFHSLLVGYVICGTVYHASMRPDLVAAHEGDLFIAWPGFSREVKPAADSGETSVYLCLAAPHFEDEYLQALFPEKPNIITGANDLRPLFEELLHQSRSGHRLSRGICQTTMKLLLQKIALHFHRNMGALHEKQTSSSKAYQSFLELKKRAEKQIQSREIAIESLAGQMGMNVTYVSRLFSRFAGMAPRCWIRQQILKETLPLIANGQKLSVIAQAAGFVDQYSFSKAFRKAFGVAPSVYRQNG